jgi:hypothetical protein
MKNGDDRASPLSHYSVIRDACPGTSPIRIHLRHALVSTRLSLKINPRRARVHVTDLIAGWGHYDTNRRHTIGDVSLIIKKARHQFNYRLGPL